MKKDNLKSNPLIYESSFVFNDVEKVSKYYIKYTDIKTIHRKENIYQQIYL